MVYNIPKNIFNTEKLVHLICKLLPHDLCRCEKVIYPIVNGLAIYSGRHQCQPVYSLVTGESNGGGAGQSDHSPIRSVNGTSPQSSKIFLHRLIGIGQCMVHITLIYIICCQQMRFCFQGESKTVKNVLSNRASTLTQMGELTALHRPHSWTKKDGKGRETERRGQRKGERGEDRWETDRVGVNEEKKEREKEKKGE